MAVTGGIVERFKSGEPAITMTVGAAVTAGQLVEMTANRTVGPAGAGSVKVVGIALQSGSAVGDKITVATGGVFNVLAAGAITAGAALIAGAAGTVVVSGAAPDARTVVGVALEDISNAASGPVKLRL